MTVVLPSILPGPYLIRAEQAADVPAREALLDRAMGPGRRRKSSEKLRRGRRPSEGLSFVARDANGTVVGTVRLWDIALGTAGAPALLLGPLAVEPSLKNGGVGSALVRHAVSEAKRLGHAAIVLVGDAAYYSRFGFLAEKTDRLAMPGPYEKHRLLALALEPHALDDAKGSSSPPAGGLPPRTFRCEASRPRKKADGCRGSINQPARPVIRGAKNARLR